MYHLEQCWAPHLLLHCSSARQRRELHVARAPTDHRKTRTRSLHLLDSGFCSSAPPRSGIPISMHTHAVPLSLWVNVCISVCPPLLSLMLSLSPFFGGLKCVMNMSPFYLSSSVLVCVLLVTGVCGHMSGALGNKTSSSTKPQPSMLSLQ